MCPEKEEHDVPPELVETRNRRTQVLLRFERGRRLSLEAQQVDVLLQPLVNGAVTIRFQLPFEEIHGRGAIAPRGPYQGVGLDGGSERGLQVPVVEAARPQRFDRQVVRVDGVLRRPVELAGGIRPSREPRQRRDHFRRHAARRSVLVDPSLSSREITGGDRRADVPDDVRTRLRGDGDSSRQYGDQGQWST